MMTIYVGNLNFRATEDEIHGLFSQYGEVASVKIISDRETGRSRGFGFVEMEEDAGQKAIEALNEYESNGRSLKVHEARERTERSSRPPMNRDRRDRRPTWNER